MEEKVNNKDEKKAPIEDSSSLDPEMAIDDSVSQTKVAAAVTVQTRIEELKESIGGAKTAFEKESQRLFWQVLLWAVINLIVIGGAICFGFYLLNPKNVLIPETWSWQVVYFSLVRVAIIAAIFAFATYCLKLLNSHIHLYQLTNHKIAIINAFPGFVESSDPKKKQIVFNKLVELVVGFNETGIISKNSELKTSNDALVKLIEVLTKSQKF